jgi:hypothetical protein
LQADVVAFSTVAQALQGHFIEKCSRHSMPAFRVQYRSSLTRRGCSYKRTAIAG